MTLLLAVFNQSGAVLASDGVGTIVSGTNAQQIPYQKVSVIGDRCACGQAGQDLTLTAGMVAALRASQLATESTLSRRADEWLTIARSAVSRWFTQYVQNTVWNAQLPLQNQFPDVRVLLVGVAADRAFAYSLTPFGTHSEPENPNYTAVGSGATSARIYLDAYSYFPISNHPVLSCVALAARVMEKVSLINMEIGGKISLLAMHRQTSLAHPNTNEEIDIEDPRVRGAIDHWEVAEDSIQQSLLNVVSQPAATRQSLNPQVAATPSAPAS